MAVRKRQQRNSPRSAKPAIMGPPMILKDGTHIQAGDLISLPRGEDCPPLLVEIRRIVYDDRGRGIEAKGWTPTTRTLVNINTGAVLAD